MFADHKCPIEWVTACLPALLCLYGRSHSHCERHLCWEGGGVAPVRTGLGTGEKGEKKSSALIGKKKT